MIRNVCVYGAGSKSLHPDYYAASEELGRLLAQNGIGVVYGGGNTGVMGYTAQGALQAGGRVIGVAPEFMAPRGVLLEECELIYTKDLRSRKQKMEELSDAFVCMPGGLGTLEEMFEIITAKTLGLHGKPIVVVNLRGIFDDLTRLAEKFVAEGFAPRACIESYRVVEDVKSAVEYLLHAQPDENPQWLKYNAKAD